MERTVSKKSADTQILSRVLFGFLPNEILLAAVGAVNGIISSIFASNFIGDEAMTAIGIYAPLSTLITALNTLLAGGTIILCGAYMGRNDHKKLQNIFNVNMIISTVAAVLFMAAFIVIGTFDLGGFLTHDREIRQMFNRYLIGQSVGIIPFVIGNQIPSFLTVENRCEKTMHGSIAYIIVNVVLNILFVKFFNLGVFGVALASSFGLWAFMWLQLSFFVSDESFLRFSFSGLQFSEILSVVRIGFPGAISSGYQTVRGILVNHMILIFVGSAGISAFAASDNVLRIFWAVPAGMLSVSRLMLSVSVGEEDRQTLTDVMRIVLKRFVPLMCCISAAIMICAVPLTRIFYRNPARPVYMMTVWGFRILPLCMPLSIICMHFICYGQVSKKQFLVHLLSLLDGVVCVAGFTALLIRAVGMNSVYIANVLNGVVTTLVILGYAWKKNRHFPRTMEELMVVPEDFGAPPEARIDIAIRSMEDVVTVSERIQSFCLSRGIDRRRSYLAALSMEEMAGNIVNHGFVKDKKTHTIDVRVVQKDDDVILRMRDDCVPFDPAERKDMISPEDISKHIGIRMVFRIASDIQYKSIVGLNVLTIRI